MAMARPPIKSSARGSSEVQTAEPPASLKRARTDREKLLDAEIVCRERREEVPINIHVVAALGSDDRARWLTRALEGILRGIARASDVYDVVCHRRFAVGISAKLASRMLSELRNRLDLFSGEPRRVLEAGEFDLARKSSQGNEASEVPDKDVDGAIEVQDEMMARCLQFVRQNEDIFKEVHDFESRTFQVEVVRSSLEQVWGFTWLPSAFNDKRRVLCGIVPGSPAASWNAAAFASGGQPLRLGDELIAVNGRRGFEAMGCIRELTQARLTFVPTRQELPAANAENGSQAGQISSPGKDQELLSPPAFARGGYDTDAGGGWRAHTGGQWLHNSSDAVYFHVPSAALFTEDPGKPGSFNRIGADAEIGDCDSSLLTSANSNERLRGRVRWFSRPKGFGFIAPWPMDPGQQDVEAESDEDNVFVHKSELLEVGSKAVPLQPSMPVTYVPSIREGKLCASCVDVETDLAALCSVSSCSGSAGRCLERASLQVQAEGGRSVTGIFAGVVTGKHGVGGAEFVSLRLARHLAVHLQGREQGGERAAKAALLATFRQVQHEFLQYANKLSANSASLWLSAETAACSALVFGPEPDGLPRLLVAVVGGGRALVVRRDGSAAGHFGGSSASNSNAGSLSRGEKAAATLPGEEKDLDLKKFDRGLKGPSIVFPPNIYSATPGMPTPAAPKGFGAHAWSEKVGSTAGLDVELHSHVLNWEDDAFVVLGSEAFWDALPDPQAAASLVWKLARQDPSSESTEAVAQGLAEVAQRRRKTSKEAIAISILRLNWSRMPLDPEPDTHVATPAADDVVDVPAAPSARNSHAAGIQSQQRPTASSGDDDMFAMPEPAPDAAHEVADEEIFTVPPHASLRSSVGTDEKHTRTRADDCVVLDDDEPVEIRPPEVHRLVSPAPVAAEAEPEPVLGPATELDDMFAQFCQEVGGVGGSR